MPFEVFGPPSSQFSLHQVTRLAKRSVYDISLWSLWLQELWFLSRFGSVPILSCLSGRKVRESLQTHQEGDFVNSLMSLIHHLFSCLNMFLLSKRGRLQQRVRVTAFCSTGACWDNVVSQTRSRSPYPSRHFHHSCHSQDHGRLFAHTQTPGSSMSPSSQHPSTTNLQQSYP